MSGNPLRRGAIEAIGAAAYAAPAGQTATRSLDALLDYLEENATQWGYETMQIRLDRPKIGGVHPLYEVDAIAALREDSISKETSGG